MRPSCTLPAASLSFGGRTSAEKASRAAWRRGAWASRQRFVARERFALPATRRLQVAARLEFHLSAARPSARPPAHTAWLRSGPARRARAPPSPRPTCPPRTTVTSATTFRALMRNRSIRRSESVQGHTGHSTRNERAARRAHAPHLARFPPHPRASASMPAQPAGRCCDASGGTAASAHRPRCS